MSVQASVFTEVPDQLEALLQGRLPYSLSLLRRLRFAKHKNDSRSEYHIIFVSHGKGIEDSIQEFTAAYLNFSSAVSLVIYSTLEDKGISSPHYEEQVAELVTQIIRLGNDNGGVERFPRGLLIGTLNTHVRNILLKLERITPRPTGFFDKWLFKAKDLPKLGDDLPERMRWDQATLGDCEIVVARTDIPRTADMLVPLANLVIRADDKTPIAWAFLSPDGSLISLHCEELYRRRGLAKKLAAKLLHQGFGPFVTDGWSCADVAASNMGSRGMCKSLGGKPHWEVSWVMFDISERA